MKENLSQKEMNPQEKPKRGRPPKYSTLEEMRAAQNAASLRYYYRTKRSEVPVMNSIPE
jgi:hypothetical protein